MKFRTVSKAALPFAMLVGLGMSQAQAADLGGDCCADLEERIAELEATTVRKGNRKVSLKLSGHVNRGVMFWDDGIESNVYAIDNANSSTRFRMTGGANITSDVSAGFNIELGVYTARSNNLTAANDDQSAVVVRKSNWYLDSKSLGRLTVGLLDSASDDITEIDLGGINSAWYFNGAGLNVSSFLIARTNGTYSATTVGTALFGEQTNDDIDGVRYDTPTIMGFKVSASWGEDDMWDIGLRYAGELGDFRVAAGIGYYVNTEVAATIYDETSWGGSAAIMHTPTGLWVEGAYSQRERDNVAGYDPDRSEWSVAAGITQKFTPLGKTTLFGAYQSSEGYAAVAGGPTDDATSYGGGIIQHIDAAAMQLYLSYKHYEFDLNQSDPGFLHHDFDMVLAGGRISF